MIHLCATEASLALAWHKIFKEDPTEEARREGLNEDELDAYPNVQIHNDSIFNVEAQAIVSPANSFGFMDGGLDQAIMDRFPGIQEKVQDIIRNRPMGELLVGEAIVVNTNDDKTPFLISAPTMRIPMKIEDTINAYLAMKAILNKVINSPIESVAIPGLGTGIGGMDHLVAATQMRQAYDDLREIHDFPKSTLDARNRHYRMNAMTVI